MVVKPATCRLTGRILMWFMRKMDILLCRCPVSGTWAFQTDQCQTSNVQTTTHGTEWWIAVLTNDKVLVLRFLSYSIGVIDKVNRTGLACGLLNSAVTMRIRLLAPHSSDRPCRLRTGTWACENPSLGQGWCCLLFSNPVSLLS